MSKNTSAHASLDDFWLRKKKREKRPAKTNDYVMNETDSDGFFLSLVMIENPDNGNIYGLSKFSTLKRIRSRTIFPLSFLVGNERVTKWKTKKQNTNQKAKKNRCEKVTEMSV